MCTNTGIESYRGLQLLYIPKHRKKEGVVSCGTQLLLSVYVCSSKLYFWQGEAVLSAEIAVKEMMFRQSWDRREAMIPSRSPNLASRRVDVGRHFSRAILLPPSPKTTREMSLFLCRPLLQRSKRCRRYRRAAVLSGNFSFAALFGALWFCNCVTRGLHAPPR